MLPVYSTFFRLKEAPFNITPDPAFLFGSASHREGLAQLRYGIEGRRGFIVLTGEVGTGKTTLIQALLCELGDEITTALIFSVITSPVDLLRYVCEEFKLVEPSDGIRDIHDYICFLNNFLLKEYRCGRSVALIIDEAQNLPPEVLESLRLLSNFETTKDKLLQILLVGQPELNERLNKQELRQLRQRITLRHHLRPLTLGECQQYIAGRLRCAGATSIIFVADAIEAVYQYSAGIPRLINVICDNSLISAYAVGRCEVTAQIVEEVARDLCLLNGAALSSGLENGKAIRRESSKSSQLAEQTTETHGCNALKSLADSGASAIVPDRFFVFLRDAFIDVMGPMGKIILSEQVQRLGASTERFPRHKIESLIDSLSREICDSSSRARFRQGISTGAKSLQ